jgi:hypothetical protein
MHTNRLFVVTLGALGLGPGSRPADVPRPAIGASQAAVSEA